eukprot:229714_1
MSQIASINNILSSLDNPKKALEEYTTNLQRHYAQQIKNTPSTYVKFNIQTMDDFEEEICKLHNDLNWSPLLLTANSNNLQREWGPGCYFFIISNEQFTQFRQFYRFDLSFMYTVDDDADTSNLQIIWLPIAAAKIFLIESLTIKLKDNHIERYLMDLGFYVFIVYATVVQSQINTIVSNRFVIGPRFDIDNKFGMYFNQSDNVRGTSVFGIHKFRKLVGRRLLHKILKYECRDILLQKLMEHYNGLSLLEMSKQRTYCITEKNVKNHQITEYVFDAFMCTLHQNGEDICHSNAGAMAVRMFGINKDEFYKFAVQNMKTMNMISIQYMMMCWIHHKLENMQELSFILHDWIQLFGKIMKERFFKQGRLHLFEQKLASGAKCKFCGRNNEDVDADKLKLCKQCKTTFYCNRHCQKRDWISHRNYCCSDKSYI